MNAFSFQPLPPEFAPLVFCHRLLLGVPTNHAHFKQLHAVSCLPRTNFFRVSTSFVSGVLAWLACCPEPAAIQLALIES
jgi:hypothetical protein